MTPDGAPHRRAWCSRRPPWDGEVVALGHLVVASHHRVLSAPLLTGDILALVAIGALVVRWRRVRRIPLA